MSTKQETYEKEMQPLIEQLLDMGEKHGINVAAVVHMEEEGSDLAVVQGGAYYDSEKNGVSPHVLAVNKIVNMPPEFAIAVLKSAESVKNRMEAAANPHGVAG